jgi:hypothetical protein
VSGKDTSEAKKKANVLGKPEILRTENTGTAICLVNQLHIADHIQPRNVYIEFVRWILKGSLAGLEQQTMRMAIHI